MINFNNTYEKLPSEFYTLETPLPPSQPNIIQLNQLLLKELGINIDSKEALAIFSGAQKAPDSSYLSMAYAGHQFGHFVPQLGDGRAVLIGEVQGKDDLQYDIQLKGSGPTYFSRRGDGLSSLGPVLREYLVSEAMNQLEIPATRALAAISTGDFVHRDRTLPGGILTRVAKSHIRIGTFEYFASREMNDELQILSNYCVGRLYPELDTINNHFERNLELFKQMSRNKLKLVCQWLRVGFIHGVMNTDNTSLSGETIDFGPCAFMDHFHRDRVFSSIDRNKRYAYSNQGQIALWNLSSLGNTFIPLVHKDRGTAIELLKNIMKDLENFYHTEWLKVMGQKFGFKETQEKDKKFIDNFLIFLQDNELDFTNSFRNLENSLKLDKNIHQEWLDLLEIKKQSIEDSIEYANKFNPYLIPRNHLIEKAIEKAYEGDLSLFYKLNNAWKDLYVENLEFKDLTLPPLEHEIVQETFCGT